jgi:ATP-dependent Lhr-like helicase
VDQTVRDCLQEAMDFNGLLTVLTRIHGGTIRCVSRDTPEPSVLAHDILNARPYAFLDDAPLEERRTQAIYSRRATEPSGANDIGALDAEAIERVRDEARIDPRDADELHDALLTVGVLTEHDERYVEIDAREMREMREMFDTLVANRRAARVSVTTTHGDSVDLWIAAERLPELLAVHPHASYDTRVVPPASRTTRVWTREEAIVELLRGRLTIVGPTTARELATTLAIGDEETLAALQTLEGEGVVLRGQFTPESARALEWCDRRLLARIHRYTLHRLRAEIEPVSPADFMRFLFAWQHVDPSSQLTGIDGLRAIVSRLDGYELPAAAWERAVLPARIDRYESSMLDVLCLTGDVGWARLSTTTSPATLPTQGTPIALFLREHAEAWQTLRFANEANEEVLEGDRNSSSLSDRARSVLDALRTRGASFSRELAAACGLNDAELRQTLAELVAAGCIASDGFAGVRALIHTPPAIHNRGGRDSRDRRPDLAGRWSLVPRTPSAKDAAVECQAWTLLARYGVVFRRLLAREANAASWRELTRVYRRLEARGEIRGGRFVASMSGEQFALPEAVDRLREIRRSQPHGRLMVISAADPLNLIGIVTPGDRVRAITSSRIVFRDGVPLAALEGDYVRPLADIPPALAGEVATTLAGRRVPPVISGYIGRVS